MEENSMVANTEEVVETPTEETTTESAELTTPQEDVTKTQSFARRLKEESRKQSERAVNDFVASMNLVNEVTGEKVLTQADYNKYMRTMKAQDEGKDPMLYNELEEAKSKYDNLQTEYNRLRRNEDIRELIRKSYFIIKDEKKNQWVKASFFEKL